MKLMDLTGQRFGRLTVVSRVANNKHHVMWFCRCDCGKETIVTGDSLKRGASMSCGCLRKDLSAIDLTGQRFGRLTVLERAGNIGRMAAWKCRCDCGAECVVGSNSLRRGHTKSCGCLMREIQEENLSKRPVKHRMSRHRLHSVWCSMRKRCRDLNVERYGARGIRVCKEWDEDFNSFKEWAFTHGYSDGLTIDRINNNGNYEPSNCRWATPEQQANNRRSNRFIAFGGEVYTLSEWAKLLDVDVRKLFSRLKTSHSIEEAFAL